MSNAKTAKAFADLEKAEARLARAFTKWQKLRAKIKRMDAKYAKELATGKLDVREFGIEPKPWPKGKGQSARL